MTEERKPPIILHKEERHLRIKAAIQLTEYQIAVFKRELRMEHKALDHLEKNQQKRKESYGVKYNSVEELNQAYIVSAMSDKEYAYQRSNIWQVYSDRGHKARIEWLEKMLSVYEKKLEDIRQMCDDMHRESVKSFKRKRKHLAYKRRVRKRIRNEEQKRRYESLKGGRWHSVD